MQEPLGHADVSTTMIYTHVLNRGGRGVVSPLDRLLAIRHISKKELDESPRDRQTLTVDQSQLSAPPV